MKIEKETRLVHCSDGRIKKEYLLTAPVTGDFARYCQDFGEVRVIGSLKKPFFTFLVPARLNIKGFIGESSIEAWFYPEYLSAGEEFLLLLVSGFGSTQPDGRLREVHHYLLEGRANRDT